MDFQYFSFAYLLNHYLLIFSKEYLKVQKLQKDTASKLKMEWLYVNRIALAILLFIITIFLAFELHRISINWVYTEPTADYDLLRRVI